MKSMVLFIDFKENAGRCADVLRRHDCLFMYEQYDGYHDAFRRIIKNNFDIMIANLDTDSKQLNVSSLVRANYNIGKHTVVRYSSVFQKMKFMLCNMDILDNLVFIRNDCGNDHFVHAVNRISSRETVPFGEIFNKYI